LKLGNGALVCLTGIDGSGKTTHARSLVAFLGEKGYNCTYVWAASRPVFSLAFFGLTKVLGYWKKTKKGMYTDPLEFAPSTVKGTLAVFWRLFLLVDFQVRVLATVRVRLLRGLVVVCDRYVYDMIMELRASQLYTSTFEELATKMVPKPAVTFLLDVNVATARSRRGFNTEQLSMRRRAFLELARKFNFVIIDSNRDFVHNCSQIRTQTLSHLPRS